MNARIAVICVMVFVVLLIAAGTIVGTTMSQ